MIRLNIRDAAQVILISAVLFFLAFAFSSGGSFDSGVVSGLLFFGIMLFIPFRFAQWWIRRLKGKPNYFSSSDGLAVGALFAYVIWAQIEFTMQNRAMEVGDRLLVRVEEHARRTGSFPPNLDRLRSPEDGPDWLKADLWIFSGPRLRYVHDPQLRRVPSIHFGYWCKRVGGEWIFDG